MALDGDAEVMRYLTGHARSRAEVLEEWLPVMSRDAGTGGRLGYWAGFALDDVRAPPGHPGAGEHRGEHVGRHLGEVEDHGRPELDVGGQHPVGLAGVQLGQRGPFQRLGDLEARGAQLLGRTPQHAGAGVLGPVDAVAEAHEPLAAVEDALDVVLGVAGALDTFNHVQHP